MYKDINLSVEQEEAVIACGDTSKRIVCVTGGAGTGKTTTLKEAYNEVKRTHGGEIALCAPTGRAAKRITEATGIEASTIHRLLEFPIPTEVKDGDQKVVFGQPKRDALNPLKQEIVFVDEYSMVGKKLHGQLLDALPNRGSIRFFGDVNQLPPVMAEQGQLSPFQDMLERYETVVLHRNFRSDDNLIENANRILDGLMPRRGDKFELLITRKPTESLREVAEDDFRKLNYQILTPMRKGVSGAVRLSSMLRTKFQPSFDVPRLGLPRFDEDETPLTVLDGDKVLWTKNDYYLNVMNGETGVANRFDTDDGDFDLVLDDRVVRVPAIKRGFMGSFYDPRRAVDLAYVMTVHKAQGSEFDTVIHVINSNQRWMLNRNNLYTAITRAKHKVILIADQSSLVQSLQRRAIIPPMRSRRAK